jgi:DNA-binding HxlR family transcriptional regulator
MNMIKRLKKKVTAPTIVRWGMTEKGKDVLPAIIRLIVFGARWHAENPFHGKPPKDSASFLEAMLRSPLLHIL